MVSFPVGKPLCVKLRFACYCCYALSLSLGNQPQWKIVQSVILPNQTAPITRQLCSPDRSGTLQIECIHIGDRAIEWGAMDIWFLWTDLVEPNFFTLTTSAVRGSPGATTSIFVEMRR
jgi:hypothetical protein